MPNPYLITGPAIISFSGGRTSGYMLRQILNAHRGTLPDDVKVCFANTGKEMPETLDFVRDCAEHWGADVVWLEYQPGEKPADRWRTVTYETASRNGEPFNALIEAKRILPNPIMRYCTQTLKIQCIRNFAWSIGWDTWTSVIGLRADEPRRVARLNNSREDASERIAPLATAGVTKADVSAFWKQQNFDLRLPNVNGTTPLGNCDLCFLKGSKTLLGIVRDRPELAQWWIDQERMAVERSIARNDKMNNPTVLAFRKDRPSYATMLKMTEEQGDLLTDDPSMPCACTD